MFNIINILILLLLIVCNEKCLCDICKTCACSLTDTGQIIDCQLRHLDRNEIFNFDLLTLDRRAPFKKLILSENNLELLPANILRNLKHLKELDLSRNHLDSIYANLFESLNDLEDVNYSYNRLWGLDGSILKTIPSLAKLNLSYNEISGLESTSKGTCNLRILDVSHNNLTDLSKDFLGLLTHLEHLDLSFNKLISFQEGSLVQLQQLRVLLISNNRLHSLNLRDLPPSLMKLHAGDNLITVLSPKKSLIHTLNLENNQISHIWENLTLLKEIRHLNLSGNYLSHFPEVILNEIVSLDLSFNNLSIIPESISVQNFPMLKTLSVSGNRLKNTRVHSELKLEVFEASFLDDIKEISEDTFFKLRERKNKCINVTISNNKRLRVIRENVFQHMNICSLDLSNNRLAHLSSKLMHNNENKTIKYFINLQGNPFICNCSLQWMLDDLVPLLYVTKPSLLEDLRCAGPPILVNRRLVHWYRWHDKVFCGDFSERMIAVDIAGMPSRQQTMFFEMTTGMLAALGTAIVLLVILTTIGILLTRKIAMKRRRVNRRF